MIFSTGLLLLASGTARADLYDEGLITYDDESGLEWLDLTATKGWSVDKVLASDYVQEDGFRYATAAEVVELFVAAGIPAIGSSSTTNTDGVTLLLDLMGVTFIKKKAEGSMGMHDIGDPGFESGYAGRGYLRLGQQPILKAKAQVSKDIVRTEAEFDQAGSYLVR
jgi:hypothetical protein